MNYDHTILLAHGSRDPNWARPFETLVSRIQKRTQAVSLAYMELAEPTLEQAVAKLHQQNPQGRIAVLPLFFAAGRHLRKDVPGQIECLRLETGAQVELLPPIGEHELFARFVEDLVVSQLQANEDERSPHDPADDKA